MLKFKEYINENYESPIIVSEYWDYGNIDAVIHKNWSNVHNWINKYGDYDESEKVLDKIKKVGLPIGCLSNINVEYEYRNSGYGNDILEYFIDECIDNDVKSIILVADLDEEQVNGFELEKWYRNKGFETIGKIYGNPLMIMHV